MSRGLFMIFQGNHQRRSNGSEVGISSIEDSDQHWMQAAIQLAQKAEELGEVPVGAIIVKDNVLISEGFNQPISQHDPTSHAEIMALRNAAQNLKNYRLPNTTLYVTLEPCAMCAGAIIHARVERVVLGTFDPKGGAAGSIFSILGTDKLNHEVDVTGGVLETECADLLKAFFKSKRKKSK